MLKSCIFGGFFSLQYIMSITITGHILSFLFPKRAIKILQGFYVCMVAGCSFSDHDVGGLFGEAMDPSSTAAEKCGDRKTIENQWFMLNSSKFTYHFMKVVPFGNFSFENIFALSLRSL